MLHTDATISARHGRTPPATAVFRCDASPRIGAGHVYRCMALAGELTRLGWHCRFLVGPETEATVPALRGAGLEGAGLEILTTTGDPADEIAVLTQGPADLLVVDHYGRNAAFETACRQACRRILAIDDAPGRRHDCDILLDPTPGRSAADYAGLIPPTAEFLLGPAHAPLRPEFRRLRAEALERRSDRRLGRVDRLLIAVGGADATAATAVAIRAAALALPDAAIDVAAGSGARSLPAIRAAVAAAGRRCTLHVDAPDMAALAAAADLAVGAPGGSSWERCALGLPALLFTVAENQRDNAAALAALGAAEDLGAPDGWSVSALAARIAAAAADGPRLRAMARAAAAVTDGAGAVRIALALAGAEMLPDGTRTALRAATAADADTILAWQSEPDARRYARNPAVPAAAEHAAWLAHRLADPGGITAIILCGDAPAGLLRLDAHPAGREISILVATAWRGRGVAAAALALARRLAPALDLLAEVLPGNTASARLFARAGYRPAGDGWLVSPAPSRAGR